MRRKDNLGLAIFLIILAIFYYELSYKTQDLKRELISGISQKEQDTKTFGGEEAKVLRAKKIDLLRIKINEGKIIFKKDSSLKEIIFNIKGENIGNINIQKSEKNGVITGELNFSDKIPGIYIEIISPQKIDLDISNVNGEEVIESAGKVKIHDIYSDTEISKSGDIVINSSYGSVKLKDIEKNAFVKTEYAKVIVQDIKGDVRIENKYGDKIVADNISGNLSVDTKYTLLYIDRIKGEIKIKNKYSDKILVKNFTKATIETRYSTIILGNGDDARLTGKENTLKIQDIDTLILSGKHSKISGSVNKIYSEGKYNTIALRVKGGKIKEASGDINLKIPEISEEFKLNLIDTPLYVKINKIDNTYFKVENTEGSLDSNFLEIREDKNNLTKAFFGKIGFNNKFILNAKFSNITIYN